MKVPNRLDLLELDIDLRIRELWESAVETFDEEDIEAVGAFMRAAYGRGYSHALTDEDPGAFYRQHGYRCPRRAA